MLNPQWPTDIKEVTLQKDNHITVTNYDYVANKLDNTKQVYSACLNPKGEIELNHFKFRQTTDFTSTSSTIVPSVLDCSILLTRGLQSGVHGRVQSII